MFFASESFGAEITPGNKICFFTIQKENKIVPICLIFANHFNKKSSNSIIKKCTNIM
jgi:hypothetical protein